VKQIGELEDRGIVTIDQIPDELKLTPRQKNQVTAVKSGERYIDRQMINNWLKRIEYPLYFFDYETLGDLIPPFDGMRPYLQIPFQYSLHKLDKPGGTLTHMEYLHQEKTNPGRQLARQLQQEIGSEGTVLVWNEGFEKSVNDLLGQMLPDQRKFFLALNRRIEDLMVPFAKGWWVDKDFFGSASLKKVQPVLAPDLSYRALTIGEGGAAQRIWMETFLEGKNQDKKAQIAADLLTYCKYDTLVMVKILEVLQTGNGKQ
jgi:hypothetical protein